MGNGVRLRIIYNRASEAGPPSAPSSIGPDGAVRDMRRGKAARQTTSRSRAVTGRCRQQTCRAISKNVSGAASKNIGLTLGIAQHFIEWPRNMVSRTLARGKKARNGKGGPEISFPIVGQICLSEGLSFP